MDDKSPIRETFFALGAGSIHSKQKIPKDSLSSLFHDFGHTVRMPTAPFDL